MFEAQAIAIEIEKIIPNRPMTHDLFKSFAHSFDYEVQEIVISDLKEGVFFAKIVCSDGAKTLEIDARPSDAIAIGLRFDAPIYTYETILAEAGIVLTDESEDDIAEIKSELKTAEKVTRTDPEDLKNFPMDKLNQMLSEAIEQEDYERAAKIRDELSRRN
jgi:bifunctional DNase/RNase